MFQGGMQLGTAVTLLTICVAIYTKDVVKKSALGITAHLLKKHTKSKAALTVDKS